MDAGIDRVADDRVLAGALYYVSGHSDNKFDKFRDAVANWGTKWDGLEPVHMRASDLLADALPLAKPGTAEHKLLSLYANERSSRYWEQSYTAADTAVGADMLVGYGYTEVVGKRGPFISEKVRAGVGVLTPV